MIIPHGHIKSRSLCLECLEAGCYLPIHINPIICSYILKSQNQLGATCHNWLKINPGVSFLFMWAGGGQSCSQIHVVFCEVVPSKGTNIFPLKVAGKMIFLFHRWDM